MTTGAVKVTDDADVDVAIIAEVEIVDDAEFEIAVGGDERLLSIEGALLTARLEVEILCWIFALLSSLLLSDDNNDTSSEDDLDRSIGDRAPETFVLVLGAPESFFFRGALSLS
eukprot:TRINITY_DN10165_c0_g2_i5.p4 TRINITY_DN10165_c0_g2~~TRINITY_DN10165_c0_g2_i5.p4  ORF type:complete len:114 (-),score=18.52 TRINITY_DN10165_c0_g2_i5:59-400(-)